VKTLDDALDKDKYDLLPSISDEAELHIRVDVTADKQRNTRAKTITWTNKPPPATRQPPNNILTTDRRLSAQAQAAVTPKQHWECFFTDEILELIVEYTNMKIAESIQENEYTAERLQHSPYIKPVDKVKSLQQSLLFHSSVKCFTNFFFTSERIFWRTRFWGW
jgi:hypothetical protein